MSEHVRIRPLTTSDIPRIVELHLAGFPTSAMTRLGSDAVRRYYKWLFDPCHQTSNIGAEIDGQIVGYVFGGIFKGAIGGFMDRNLGFIVKKFIFHPWLLFHPEFRKGFKVLNIYIKRRVFRIKSTAAERASHDSSYGILAITVDPAFRGKRIAQLMLEDQERTAIDRNFNRMGASIRLNNESSIRSFLKSGFVLEGSPNANIVVVSKTLSKGL